MIVNDKNEVIESRLIHRDIGQKVLFLCCLVNPRWPLLFFYIKKEQNGTEKYIWDIYGIKVILIIDMSKAWLVVGGVYPFYKFVIKIRLNIVGK